MSVRTTRVRPDALRPRCVACGYDGPELSGPSVVPGCPGCGCDFAERPPRSYAQMEGLAAAPG